MSSAKEKIWLSAPHMTGREIHFVQEAFDSNWIAPLGPQVNAFESELTSYVGVKAAAALSSGTAALHLALLLLGVKPEDEVLCASFTFIASASPITYLAATPIFVDSESESWGISPEFLRQAIEARIAKGKKPKAVIVVDLYGMPACYDEIEAICAHYEIPLIEDAAEGLGANYKGRKLGSFGALSVLSFNGNKIITTSGGGALLSNSLEQIERARFYATQARDPAPHYEHTVIGFNYRMSNVLAGIGRGQLESVDLFVKKTRALYESYRSRLSNLVGLSFVKEPSGYFSNRWLSTLLINSKHTNSGKTREDVRLALERENIESRPLWKPMHLQPVFKNAAYYGSDISESLFRDGLCLPSTPGLTEIQLDRVCSVVENVLK